MLWPCQFLYAPDAGGGGGGVEGGEMGYERVVSTTQSLLGSAGYEVCCYTFGKPVYLYALHVL